MIGGLEVYRSSGNLFADFGDPDAERKNMKAQLAAQIIILLNDHKMTVRQGAKLAKVDPADIQRIRNADLSRFSLDRLILIALNLGLKVELRIQAE